MVVMLLLRLLELLLLLLEQELLPLLELELLLERLERLLLMFLWRRRRRRRLRLLLALLIHLLPGIVEPRRERGRQLVKFKTAAFSRAASQSNMALSTLPPWCFLTTVWP